MATCYTYLDTRSKTAEKFPLKIAISHKSKRAYIPTGYYLALNEWNVEKRRIKPPYKNCGRANAKVSRKYAIVAEVIESLRPYFKQLNAFQIKEAVEEKISEVFQEKAEKEAPKILHTALNSEYVDSTCLFDYTKDVINHFYTSDKGGSARAMENMVRSLKAYTGKNQLPFKYITKEFLKDYEAWYLQQFNASGKKNSVNGLGFNTKEVRRVFNIAINDEKTTVTQEIYPFGRNGYSIKKEKTKNKNVDPSEIAKIFDLELPPETSLWHHLNYFKYYFECWGMNFIDIAYLRVYQVQNGRLQYRRRKTRWSKIAKKFDIGHSPTAQKIIDYYTKGKKASDFVFPILHDIFYLNTTLDDKAAEVKNKQLFEYKLRNKRNNHIKRLKTISKKAGLTENISIYVGRHSFFSIALRNGVSKSEISELAGHSNYQVTENYLAGFSGEQLTASADMVRSAVAQYTHKKVSILDNKITRNDNGQKQTVIDFLSRIWTNASNQEQNATHLLIVLLQQTDCNDGAKAQEYVDCFLQSREKSNMVSIAAG